MHGSTSRYACCSRNICIAIGYTFECFSLNIDWTAKIVSNLCIFFVFVSGFSHVAYMTITEADLLLMSENMISELLGLSFLGLVSVSGKISGIYPFHSGL